MPLQEAPSVAERVTASLTLMGVVAVSVFAALSLPALSTSPTTTATKQMPAVSVRIVDAPRAKEGCAEQTWPYIEARCLTRAANNAAPLANTGPSKSALPVAPSASAPQVVPSAPQIAVAEPVAPVRSKSLPSDPQPTARDAANTSVVMTADARAATIAGPAAASLAMTSLAAVEEPKVRPRAERRRRAIHSSHSFGLFGFRIVGSRF